MATKQKRKKTGRKRRRSRKNEWQKIIQSKNFLGGIFVLLALIGYFSLGYIGVLVANVFRLLTGDTFQVLLVIFGFYGAVLLITGKEPKFKKYLHYLTGGSLLYLGAILVVTTHFFVQANQHNHFITTTWQALSDAFRYASIGEPVGGGMLGSLIYTITDFCFSEIGSLFLGWLMIILGGAIFLGIPMDKVLQVVAQLIKAGVATLKTGLSHFGAYIQTKWHTRQARTQHEVTSTKQTPTADQQSPTVSVSGQELMAAQQVPSEKITAPSIHVASEQEKKVPQKTQEKVENITETAFQNAEEPANPNYKLPQSSLLTTIPQTDQSQEYKTIQKNTKILQQTLTSFGVKATVESVSLGPSVTEYELHPDIGVKVSKIVALADDIALALAAKDIRIEAPIPGKSLIGIEVPNTEIATVSFRDIIEAQPPHPDAILQVPIGRDVSGNLVLADLVRMQHLLIAGATGSGKSVMINVIITSLLMNARPDQVKFILIDPKKVELGIYKDIPHLLTPVVTNPKKAARALHKVVAEMQHRYDLFAESGQKNIKTYNQYITEENKKDGKNRPHLPYIVVVVDELADLMMVAQNAVEDAIIRLAQLARAAGIHMIIATQRPSVDVVTGLIKANVPSRIAFAVASGTDSRTIIDANGAEKLLGRGDMLYYPMGKSKPERVQGAFISDRDVKAVVDFVKQQQKVAYDESLIVTDEEAQAEEQAGGEEKDELYDQAVALVTEMQKASTSMLQRRFRIGYNRAARIVDQLEANGVVGPQEGSKPRQVFTKKE
ncbi:DNA translocase FtsK [Pediococcus siamensis]|uniref:DNA translocase FtsK n=1 Tax=Pediococcus siamensis TaxID=381829 RepID=UPI0039A00BD1